ncbi:MAG: type II secretion system F family protein, partial [Clostridia bacterium]|nr:type II secretion system F family protein [Clostridia bacterium]
MPVYRYKAKNIFGQEISGTFEGADKAAVVYMLREKKYFPLKIIEEKKAGHFSPLQRLFRKVTQKDMAVFCRQFSTMFNAGIPILACLDILRKQTENVRLKETLDTVYEEVQKGKSLSRVMGEFRLIFPELLINMIETGEISGTLDKVLERMASHYEKEYKINQKVRNALTYPAIIAIVATLVIIFLVTIVVPTFATMFASMGA